MTNSQASMQLDRTEENFVAELKAKPTEELRRFLAGPWTASILSPQALEELYQYQELRQKVETPQQKSSIGAQDAFLPDASKRV
jgi:hypothetical protein